MQSLLHAGGGKSVLLQLLAGQLRQSSFLHMTGDVKYNGCRPNEFVIQNVAGGIGLLLPSCFMRCDLRCLSVAYPAAALVDEFDDHIANLSCR